MFRLNAAACASLLFVASGACGTTGEPAEPRQITTPDGSVRGDDSGTDVTSPSIEAGDAISDSAGDAADGAASCKAAFAGCVTFTDATSASADRTVTFQDFIYSPKCISIKSGQTVTFGGDFIRHPLVQSCGPAALLDYRDAGTTASFQLTAPGVYGYYCLDHGNPQGDVMSGAVQVVP